MNEILTLLKIAFYLAFYTTPFWFPGLMIHLAAKSREKEAKARHWG